MKFSVYFWISALVLSVGPFSVLVVSAQLPGLDASELPEAVRRPVKYFGDIHPVLAQHCVECHGPASRREDCGSIPGKRL